MNAADRPTPSQSAGPDPNDEVQRRRFAALTLTALGVVYGDIGTSPLYAVRECFAGELSVDLNAVNVLGVLSLALWSLIIVISVKYLGLVMRADNQGEGGILALMALALKKRTTARQRWVITMLGLFGAGLLIGDGMITPAISVLSAVEGLSLATAAFKPYVVPITVFILCGLFLFQRRGTSRVGGVFWPVMLVWFSCLALLGIRAILRNPIVLEAASPHYAVEFFFHNGWPGVLILGTVFLVVTGGEALYADMGHFGANPIRTAWYVLVLPSLLINYFGQGALLISNPATVDNPFYHLAPDWAHYPLVVLATAATVIASQAVISGAFSLGRQAAGFGYLPRLAVVHTSSEASGQVYLPAVNWLLFVAVVGLVFFFQSSGNLAAAYGMAVNTTMLITAGLLYVVARDRWQWPGWLAGSVVGLFLVVDVAFFVPNLAKVPSGGWFPLTIGAAACVLATTWKRGRRILEHDYRAKSTSTNTLMETIRKQPPQRVPGGAVYLTGHPDAVPAALLRNLEHNKVLHEKLAILTFVVEDVPRVPPSERIDFDSLGLGVCRIVAHVGFMEHPRVEKILRQCKPMGVDFTLPDTTFFLGRETVVLGGDAQMAGWRKGLFLWMSRNAGDPSTHFDIPADQVVEIGVQVEI